MIFLPRKLSPRRTNFKSGLSCSAKKKTERLSERIESADEQSGRKRLNVPWHLLPMFDGAEEQEVRSEHRHFNSGRAFVVPVLSNHRERELVGARKVRFCKIAKPGAD